MIAFLAHFLIVLAAWTVAVKYAFPVGYALWEGSPPGRYVMVDFWWVVHLWLAWALLRWRTYTYSLAIFVSVAEIVIVVTKFVLFLAEPRWDIWTASWFVNKCFVLAVFVLMLGYFVTRGSELRAERPDRSDLGRASP